MQSIWITLGPILVINVLFLVTLLIYLARREKLPPIPDLAGRHQSWILSRTFHEYWYWVTTPPARLFVQLRLSPNVLTTIGTLINCAAAGFFAVGQFGIGGWTMILGSTFDMFDGRVARLTGRLSRSGAYFDSIMDRFSEGIVFLGLAYYYRESWLLPVVIVALLGSLMVSYARARGEGVGVVCKKGPMQRPERIAYLGVASVFQPIAHAVAGMWFDNPPAILVMGALLIIALFTLYTAFYRTIYIMNALDTADRARDADETIPQLISKLSTKSGREDLLTRARYGYPRGQARSSTVIVFVLSGAQSPIMQDLLQRGDLPHVARYLIERGGYQDAVSVFPSTTGIAALPLVTGCFPGTCNIPGMRWFDRTVPPHRRFTLKRFRDYSAGLGSYAIDFDLSKEVETIFEYSRQAVNLLGVVNRGSGFRRDPAFLYPPRIIGGKEPEALRAMERTVFEWFAHNLRRQPDFIYYYFPTIGPLVRTFGSGHPSVREAYRRFDTYLDDVVTLLKNYGLFEHTAMVLSGDHGFSEARHAFDLDTFLEKQFPLMVHAASPSYRRWLEAEAINLMTGNGMSHLYLRSKRSWERRQTMAEIEATPLIERLLETPAVDLVMGRSESGGVVVRSRRGRATILEREAILYETHGGDPFGYGVLPTRLTSREVLAQTIQSRYPDGPVQVVQLFRSPRAGDLVLSAADGYCFGPQTTPLSEGRLCHETLMVPCAMSIPSCHDGPLRTADLFPLVLHEAGLQPRHTIDGKVSNY
ncbi:MAG: alkaline phosphatase family protein [Deltaproteobacteria bacterium]|nr:alkaline phosphatase family protein [Deltaproteobacteria bacterium]